MPFIFEIEICTKKRMQIYKICINYLLKFYKKREMHGTGQTTKSMPDYREPQADEKRQKVFCDITWEHPAE